MRLTVPFAYLADSLIDGLSSSCSSFLGHFQLDELSAEEVLNVVRIYSLYCIRVRVLIYLFSFVRLFEEPFKLEFISSAISVRIKCHKLGDPLQDSWSRLTRHSKNGAVVSERFQ
jgi:hypothetical protein